MSQRLAPADIEKAVFRTAFRGYDLAQVDDFLDRVVATLRYWSDGTAVGEPPLTAEGVAATEFRMAFKGYDVEDVDDLLQQVARTLFEYER